MRIDRRRLAAPPLLDHPQADVRRDPVQPGTSSRPRLEAADAAPGAQHRLLQRVVGVVQRAEHPVAVHVQRRRSGRGQLHERLLVTCRGRATATSIGAGRYPGIGGGAPSSVHPGGSNAPGPAERDESDAVRPGQDPPLLLRPDAGHRPRPQLEPLLAGDERRRARERDVDLLLVRVECVASWL